MDALMRQEPEAIQKAISAYGAHQSDLLHAGVSAAMRFFPRQMSCNQVVEMELDQLFSSYGSAKEE
ncbi:hypothetical protein MMC10_002773 [Thelotrema lepadinum]|nr:hypothetical protein [Thelotrema lepadinum]